MTRRARENSLTGIYHVMLRGINRQEIFHDRDDYWKFIKILYQQVNPKDMTGQPLPPRCDFYAYCLMPNHVHLLVKAGNELLGNLIKSIGIAYAAYYNKRYVRVGHLFQDRFRSEPVNDINYFITLIRYVHQNPVAGGLTKCVADYPWSSWLEYLSPERCQMPVCTTSAVIKRFSLDELKELVDEPLAKSAVVLEFDKEERDKLAEEDLRDFLTEFFGFSDHRAFKRLSDSQLEVILKIAHNHGFSIRRLAHFTGLTTHAIYKSIR